MIQWLDLQQGQNYKQRWNLHYKQVQVVAIPAVTIPIAISARSTAMRIRMAMSTASVEILTALSFPMVLPTASCSRVVGSSSRAEPRTSSLNLESPDFALAEFVEVMKE